MAVIYEPTGRAREYSELALNLYNGCSHGCIYCYASNIRFRTREDFTKYISPRDDILNKIKKESPKIGKYYPDKPILLCFLCDPYQEMDELLELTREALRILSDDGCSIQVLTKAGTKAIRDFDILRSNPLNSFGTTLTGMTEDFRAYWEPNTATYESRVEAIEKANSLGIKTWVSLEPVIDPETTYFIIEDVYNIVDHFKVGKLNYHSAQGSIDWGLFKNTVVSILEHHNKSYYIKNDLMVYN
jgi:DNA repair photolyase